MTRTMTQLGLREIAAMAFAIFIAEKFNEELRSAEEVALYSETGGDLHGDDDADLAVCKLKGDAGLYEGTVWWNGNEDHHVRVRLSCLRRPGGMDALVAESKEYTNVPEFYALTRPFA